MYWITGILGFVLVVAPWMFGYANNVAGLWTSLFIGGATIVLSWLEGIHADKERWEYWTAAALGIVAICAPFVFGFSESTSALWTSIIMGGLVLLFAGGRLIIKNNT